MDSASSEHKFAKLNRAKSMNPPSDWDDMPVSARYEIYSND